jgi:hypothetical protein
MRRDSLTRGYILPPASQAHWLLQSTTIKSTIEP